MNREKELLDQLSKRVGEHGVQSCDEAYLLSCNSSRNATSEKRLTVTFSPGFPAALWNGMLKRAYECGLLPAAKCISHAERGAFLGIVE